VSERDVSVLRGAYEAFARGDIPAVLAVMDPAIVWHCPTELPFGGTFCGPEEVVGYFQTLAEAFDALAVVPERFLDAGPEAVVVEGHDRAVVAGEAADIAFLHLATLRDGKLVAFREYLDSGRLLRHLERVATV
jgi:ketosteroid isomerase-like protein